MSTPTRTMTVHGDDSEGWYFTVYEAELLLHMSTKNGDRVGTTVQGIKFLDNLNLVDYNLREQKKGKCDG